jgi:hypothetical protein
MSERVESLSTWWKPVDGGSNPSAPTPTHSQCNRLSERSRGFSYRGSLAQRRPRLVEPRNSPCPIGARAHLFHLTLFARPMTMYVAPSPTIPMKPGLMKIEKTSAGRIATKVQLSFRSAAKQHSQICPFLRSAILEVMALMRLPWRTEPLMTTTYPTDAFHHPCRESCSLAPRDYER